MAVLSGSASSHFNSDFHQKLHSHKDTPVHTNTHLICMKESSSLFEKRKKKTHTHSLLRVENIKLLQIAK